MLDDESQLVPEQANKRAAKEQAPLVHSVTPQTIWLHRFKKCKQIFPSMNAFLDPVRV